MYCNHCGKELPDDARFCDGCGNPIQPDQNMNQDDPYASFRGTAGYPGYGSETSKASQYGMGWYKFLVYFVLWASAIYNIYYGIQIMQGKHYEGYEDIVYDVFPKLKPVDNIFGILCILAAAISVLTAVLLLRYSKRGPVTLYFLYVYNIVVAISYLIAVRKATGLKTGSLNTVNLTLSVVFLIINYVYFTNRKELFCR